MNRDLLAMGHYRLHVMEAWPDGPKKQAGLAAVRSEIDSLEPGAASAFRCAECLCRQQESETIYWPGFGGLRRAKASPDQVASMAQIL